MYDTKQHRSMFQAGSRMIRKYPPMDILLCREEQFDAED